MKGILFAVTLSIALLPRAQAGSDAWTEAFPEDGQKNTGAQTIAVMGEGVLGGGGLLASRLAGDGSDDTAKQSLDRKFRDVAREEVIAVNPNYGKSLAAQNELAAQIQFNNKWGVGHQYDARLRREAVEKEIASLADDFAKGDAMMKSKLAGFYAGMKSGKVPKAVESIVDRFKRSTKQSRILAGVSALVVVDGGLRMLSLINGRDPGYIPAVSMGRSSVKVAPIPKAAEQDSAGEASMTVR